MDELKDYIFTFGSGQVPGIGMFCRIKALNPLEARTIMAKRTRKYAFMYDSEEKAGVFKYNLKEVFWDDGYRGWSECPIVCSGKGEKESAKFYALFEGEKYIGTYTTVEKAREDMIVEINNSNQLSEDDFSILETELNTTVYAVSRKVAL